MTKRTMRHSFLAVLLFLGIPLTYASPAVVLDLTFEDRVRAQEAIERVYYSHQVGTTMAFEDVVTQDVLERKVRNYIQKGEALDKIWHTPITADMLQREVERMFRSTRLPQKLNELFAALGNDPVLIRECLARPALTDRLSRNFFNYDASIHSESRRQAEALREELVSTRDRSRLRGGPPLLLDFVRTLSGDGVPAPETSSPPSQDDAGAPMRVPVTAMEFERLRSRVPGRIGAIGMVTESETAFTIDVPVSRAPQRIRLARYTVDKVHWDDWWTSVQDQFAGLTPDVSTSPDRQPIADALIQPLTSSTCAAGDQWEHGVMDDLPDPRTSHAVVWTGNLMIVWGGYSIFEFNTGSRYDPATDTWSSVTTTNAPSPRQRHTAVWTGSQMIVWGGVVGGSSATWFNTGGRYDPTTDTWLPVSSLNAPAVRSGHHAFWIGDQMIVFGGTNCCNNLTNGGRYDPTTDTWRSMSTTPSLTFRASTSAVWTGQEMVVWGGYDGSYRNTGARYNPRTDTWRTMSSLNAPSGRIEALTVWTGTRMIVWGGTAGSAAFNTGGQYDPVADTWTTTSLAGAPPFGHNGFTAIWTGSEMIVWGGSRPQSVLIAGRYDPQADTWMPLSNTNAPAPRFAHTAIWTGSLMVVWGGSDGYSRLNTGGRYDPATDSWTPTSLAGVPEVRYGHTALWTGNVMVVWGGGAGLTTGGRYDPATDSWAPTSTTGAPANHVGHTAVWTGSEMIVWGGTNGSAPGARYDPVADSWAPISNVNAPLNRTSHSVVWTGREMIVWGGVECTFFGCPFVRTGGRYDPGKDTWSATSTSNAPSTRRNHTAVWTGQVMIVWGGDYGYSTLDGGRYDPASDTWSPVDFFGAPEARTQHTAVWTGHEMVVWGGADCSPYNCFHLNTGSRYDPSSDRWNPMATSEAPTGRRNHTAVWTGEQMIVWGGSGDQGFLLGTGGRYSASSNSWSSVSMDNAPLPRSGHTAVWTGPQMIVWGGTSGASSGGRYCACATSFFFRDADGDGYGSLDVSIEACSDPAGFVANSDDCDDDNPVVHVGAPEICNSIDDNCDGRIDEGFGVGDECAGPLDVCHRSTGTRQCRHDGSGTECDTEFYDPTPPSITCPADSTLECPTISSDIGQASATDVCDPAPTVKSDAPAHLPLGTSVITWTATDASGNATTCQQRVVSVDTTPPRLSCPVASATECTGPAGAPVGLVVTASDACSSMVQIQNDHTPNGADGSGVYPLGTTSVTFNAIDTSGNVATCNAPVKVQDTTPPVLAVVSDSESLWPPNHRMVPVQAAWQVNDICDSAAAVVLASATSSEPDDAIGSGDGNTTGDIQDASIGTPDTLVMLRAERITDRPGRVYALTYTATDASGNSASALGLVTVPHDLGMGPEPVSLGLKADGSPGMAHLFWNSVSGAEMYDVIQGELNQMKAQDGVIRLGPVHVLASGQSGTSYSEDSSAALPHAGQAFFYLVQYRTGMTASGWGTESSPLPAEPTSCDIGCPGR